MRAAWTLLFILSIGSQGVWSRSLQQETEPHVMDDVDDIPANATFCKAFGHLQIVVTGGKCSGQVESDCKAISQAKNRIAKAFDDWWGEAGPGLCATGQANATAVAHAKAIAKVWSTGLSSVKCENQGFACGYVLSNSSSWAIAFAEAIAEAAAEAGATREDGGPAGGFCFADVRALTATMTSAMSSAKGKACSYGGDKTPIEFFEESYADAIRIGIAEAYARAIARACDDSEDGRVKASSKCQGGASIDGIGSERNAGSGNSKTEVGEVQGCQGDVKLRCCDRPIPQKMCVPCKGCARLRRLTEKDARKNIKRSWELEDGSVCFCRD